MPKQKIQTPKIKPEKVEEVSEKLHVFSDDKKEKKIEIVPENKTENKTEESKTETKIEEKKVEEKKKEKEKPKIEKKTSATVYGKSLRISPKFASDVCRVIRGKTPDEAITRLNLVLKFRRAIPMENREVAHQKGAGIAGGKFPINVCNEFVKLLRQVNANAVYNGVENPVIVTAMANKASQPFRRGRVRAKRAHVFIEVKESKMEKK